MITKLAFLSIAVAALLVAADVWTKPATDWSEKDVETIITDSPWADRMAVETGQRGVISNADDGKAPMQGNLTTPIVVAWRTALPIRQALAKRGQPASDAEPNFSILLVSLIPGQFRADTADNAKLIADTTIKVKGKADIHPTEIQIPPPAAPPGGGKGGPGGPPGGGKGGFGGGGNFDLLIVFPKSAGLSADDKEFDFTTKVGKMTIRKKFKLKDMVYNGKLEM